MEEAESLHKYWGKKKKTGYEWLFAPETLALTCGSYGDIDFLTYI